ncbi:hypothetical protein [Tunicatimonas pelagia]|uniref:hypothetical protein n=1 Tax=Tunicatimonas pelagia TaxID=931531 RepID=UPI00266611C9|nr:hypothetical protein [Tunicatimonas pelagia]WKN42497.1 hypothetical protein P0M28_26020 [Tunicatimonas pelagia]
MSNFLKFLENHATGIYLIILCVFSLILAINWLAKIFSWGVYQEINTERNAQSKLSYVISRFFVNIIDDFKHLLAIIIVIIFTALIIYSMTAGDTFDDKMEALQLVIASLGGLLGSIIGYYFGESAARTSTPKVVDNEKEIAISGRIVAAPQLTLEDQGDNPQNAPE